MMLETSGNAGIRKTRIVIDTSILISAVLVDGAYRKLLRKLLLTEFALYIPQEVLDEFEEKTQEQKFQKYRPFFTEILDELHTSAIILPSAKQKRYMLKHCKEDEGIINCCVENVIDYLVTSDKRTVGKYNGLEVIFAQDFYYRFLTN